MHSAVLCLLSDKVLSTTAWDGVGRCGAVRRSVSGSTYSNSSAQAHLLHS